MAAVAAGFHGGRAQSLGQRCDMMWHLLDVVWASWGFEG